MKNILLGFLFTSVGSCAFSQVGINVKQPEATLDIHGKNHLGAVTTKDGFIIPRVSSLATNGSANGQLIYLSSNWTSYTKGFHFWDSSKNQWLKIGTTKTDDTKDAWADDSINKIVKLESLSNGTPRTNDKNMVITDEGMVGIGSLSPIVKLDVRQNPGNTSPGGGSIAIGETSKTANAAGAGALRYNATSKNIEYSDGSTWNSTVAVVQKSLVVAKKLTSQTFSSGGTDATKVTDWKVDTDINANFTPATGVFKAPRAGAYIVSFSFNFINKKTSAGKQVEAILETSNPGNKANDRKSLISYPASGSVEGGSALTFALYLEKDQEIRPSIWQDTGSDQTLRVAGSVANENNSNDGFVNFSVVEI